MHTKKYRASTLTDKKKSNSVRRRKKNIEQTENLPTPPSKIKWSVPYVMYYGTRRTVESHRF
jgi:hypothetical protein